MKCVAGTRKLLTNLKLASMAAGGAPYGLVEDAAVAIEAGRIAWAGARADLPSHHAGWPVEDMARPAGHAGADRLPHPHRVTAATARASSRCGWKAQAMRRSPAPAAVSSRRSRHPRRKRRMSWSDDALPASIDLLAEGVTTLEIKSGYGLDVDTELNMLRAARRIAAERPVRVKTSFSAPMRCRRNTRAAPTPISTTSASRR
jgi:imidazolonepropionase